MQVAATLMTATNEKTLEWDYYEQTSAGTGSVTVDVFTGTGSRGDDLVEIGGALVSASDIITEVETDPGGQSGMSVTTTVGEYMKELRHSIDTGQHGMDYAAGRYTWDETIAEEDALGMTDRSASGDRKGYMMISGSGTGIAVTLAGFETSVEKGNASYEAQILTLFEARGTSSDENDMSNTQQKTRITA
ncbi:hypothetical protein GOB93_03445 [Acetobacter musti]|uniref:Uncharacterized protein n=1 Tax=Acetobacter musti TaxID=864732 RepID=A0ABX0JM46_9PROT|nr:hypothetical protein [Acetobacter musti]NHN83695.1 hypothetical protein [Acetobacter musti]